MNYYDAYVKTQEELIKLRQAHAVLISMMQEGKIKMNPKEYRGGIGIQMAKAGHQRANIAMKSNRNESGSLSEYLSCGTFFSRESTMNSGASRNKLQRPLSKDQISADE